MDVDSRGYFSSATAVVSIPTSVKVFSYVGSIVGSRSGRGVTGLWCIV